MFIVVGETHSDAMTIGTGETLENAITNWASTGANGSETAEQKLAIFEEFEQYNPQVFEGEWVHVTSVRKVEIKYSAE